MRRRAIGDLRELRPWGCPRGCCQYDPPGGEPAPLSAALGWHKPGKTPLCPFCLDEMQPPPADAVGWRDGAGWIFNGRR